MARTPLEQFITGYIAGFLTTDLNRNGALITSVHMVTDDTGACTRLRLGIGEDNWVDLSIEEVLGQIDEPA